MAQQVAGVMKASGETLVLQEKLGIGFVLAVLLQIVHILAELYLCLWSVILEVMLKCQNSLRDIKGQSKHII